jgi:uroporphyrinogen decarboxylase
VWETDPSVGDFLAACPDKCIVGGLRRFKITEGALDEIRKDVESMAGLTGGRRLLLAPGCVIRAPCDRDTLSYLRRAVAEQSTR